MYKTQISFDAWKGLESVLMWHRIDYEVQFDDLAFSRLECIVGRRLEKNKNKG